MDLRPHYAFALGYAAGVEGAQSEPERVAAKLQEYYNEGYEQGASDDMFGEINAELLAD